MEELRDDLSNYDASAYKNPSVTVDMAVCSIIDDDLKVLLIERRSAPFRGFWAIPGGFLEVDKEESLEETAARELLEETNLSRIYLEQLGTYGDPKRDPRKRIITIVYYALLPCNKRVFQGIEARSDAKDAQWFSLRKLPRKLAFDHRKILKDLLKRLEGKISYTPIAFSLIPKRFTWAQLQKVYEVILGREIHAANFRRKMHSLYLIERLDWKERTQGRPSYYLNYKGLKKL